MQTRIKQKFLIKLMQLKNSNIKNIYEICRIQN